MNAIKRSDLQVLSQYNFIENGSNRQNNHLIGLKWIREGAAWRQELIEVKKQDVSCWSLFLSIFGIGKLKHISLSLDKVCSHLSKYKWKEMKLEVSQNHPEENDYKKAFKTVCHLANRQIQRHRFQLFKEVSDPIQGDFNHYWNLAMNGRFLLSLQRYRLPDAVSIELRFKDSKTPVLPNQMLTKNDTANIEVGFKYELITEEETDYGIDDDDEETTTIYYYHYPFNPYYSIDIGSEKLLPRRKEL
jgi:hypothetical protein